MCKTKFNLDQDYCIGCTRCYELASDNFKADPNSKGGMRAEVVKQPQDEDEEWICDEAFNNCPTGAISKVDEHGEEHFNQ